MSLISLRNARKFLQKTPEERRITARFVTALLLAKLPYAPHRVRMNLSPQECVSFWWSCFSGAVDLGSASIFEYEYSGRDLGYLRFLWKFLQPGMTFFDIGSYHGIYALIAAKRLGSAGRVFAFEPSPAGFRRLNLHLHLNRISCVTTENRAIAAEKGTASLFTVLDGHPDMNSLRHAAAHCPVGQTTVETTTLDRYLQQRQIDRVDLVKIDTEGAEMDVFRGADRLLRQLRPLVICEVLDIVTRPWGYPACEIITQLRGHGYEWFDILRDGSVRCHSTQCEYTEVKNYLAVPKEMQHRIENFRSAKGADFGGSL